LYCENHYAGEKNADQKNTEKYFLVVPPDSSRFLPLLYTR
jgi:hypothetical protein